MQENRYTFHFKSSAWGVCEYTVSINGRAIPGRIETRNGRARFSQEPMPPGMLAAFNRHFAEMYDRAREKYPETPPAPLFSS